MKPLKLLSAILMLVIIIIFSCRKTDRLELINIPPIARAGADTIIILPIDSIQLNGSGSSDPDGQINEYAWSKISGPASFSFANPAAMQTTINKLKQGVYQIELQVTDNDGLFAKDTLLIVVDSVSTNNHPPIANAGTDQKLHTTADFLFFDGVIAVLDGSKSIDPDSNDITFQWTDISGVTPYSIVNAAASKTEVFFYEYGAYEFQLKVTDDGGLSSTDTVKVMIELTDSISEPPVANAGLDQSIFLPNNSVILDGKMSFIPDKDIVTYQWTKVSGPSPVNISSANAIQTAVTFSAEGIYNFELKVTDTTKFSSVDTVKVTVNTCGVNRPKINAPMTYIGKLPHPRYDVAIASIGNKIFFAGGASDSEKYGSSVVDIYDMSTHSWSTATLSEPRYSITAIAAGNKIFFAGGEWGEIGDLHGYLSAVDIYDASTNSWSTTSLSRRASGMAAGAAGNKVLFAGGQESGNRVDIYDLETGSWSLATLNETKGGISAVSVDDKVYFAGGILSATQGYSDKIDIYDYSSNRWSTSKLASGKFIYKGGVAFKNKLVWAGGWDASGQLCKVEINDPATQATKFDYLSKPGLVNAILANDKVIYLGTDNEIDVYDINSASWSIAKLPQPFYQIFAADNSAYLYNSYEGSFEIWRLDF